jgi:Caspase domain/Domain of unknown function (DUF4189)
MRRAPSRGVGASAGYRCAVRNLEVGGTLEVVVRFVRGWLTAVFLVVFAIAAFIDPSLADTRVALVIGNGAYRNAPQLPNPANDAADVAASLKRSGFDAILATDLDKAAMDDAMIRFARVARTADVAMFYYSGHALQFGGANYLAPIDIKLNDEADLRRMIRVDEIVADLQQAKNLRILVLDSCRDNPLAEEMKRSIGTTRALPLQRGLAKIDSPQGMIVAYATQVGRTADDGGGRNSPYTKAFLNNIEAKEEIGTIFRRIGAEVYETTKHEQLPELSLSLIGEFYLRGKIELSVKPDVPAAAPDPAQREFEATERVDTLPAWDAFLAQHPGGLYAALAQERRAKAAARIAALSPGNPVPVQAEKAVVADGTAATNDLLFWKFVDTHRSRQAIEAYLQRFPDGYFAEVARSRLLNMKSEVASADASAPAIDRLREPEIRIANRSVVVFTGSDAANGRLGELQKGAEVIVRGSLPGGDLLVLQAPYEGYAPARAFDAPSEADQQQAAGLRAAQRKLVTAISMFDDDAARLLAPVWGAVAVDQAATFYASTAKPDKDTASTTVMDDCRKSSKAGNCNLVRMLFRTCFALTRKSSDTKKWAWAIRDTPEQAKTDSMAACVKSNGTCKQSWLVCGDNRR